MQKTMQQLITDVERMLYQAAGVSVQMYSQDLLMQQLQHAFDHIFTSAWWPSFIRREIGTLDGVTGKTIAPFTLIKEFKDIHSVFRANQRRPLPTMPMSINTLDLPDTGVAKFIEGRTDAYLVTCYPLTAADQIVLIGRERPALEFMLSDVVPFDHLALEYFAVWSYFVDDASNSGAASKYQGLFDARVKELKDTEFKNVVMLNPTADEIPTTWHELG